MKVLISGGRTGGHLIPGIALYLEAKKRKFDCLYAMSSFDPKYPIVSLINESDRVIVDVKNISRKLSWKTPIYIFKIIRSFFKIFKVIKHYNPDIVIITGGYISNPVALSAVLLKKPLYILEQNSVAGITNRFYAKFARKVFTSFPKTEKIPEKKAIFSGNPSIFKKSINKEEAKKFFDVTDYPFVIGITSGSQGARIINRKIIELLSFFLNEKIALIWSAGSVEYEILFSRNQLKYFQEKFPNIRVSPFIEKMDYFFSAIDMVISRAGATSISEIINYGVPYILIPIKNSPDNHQLKNAYFIMSKGGGFVWEEDKLENSVLKESITLLKEHNDLHRRKLKKLKDTIPEKPEEFIFDYITSSH